MTHRCSKQNADYHKEKSRKHYLANKEAILIRTSIRNKQIASERKELLSQFTCMCCDNPDPDVVQWHHVDPSTKVFTIFKGGYGEDKFWDEVLKCIPLCANCHVKLHKEKLCLLPIHL